ncbi:hypothetical protein ABE61_04670 [Lysinibacillus sphaericus]|uniref:DUF2326 domain-containing protein n=1 Tax=Lysinibacillus sphaericus TaxID=1421 RepID=UPI0018CED157|nr:DUF2326 domain-containing protein [Lysinibacillus sphaericus]MBG9453383.1 hypothetical protein [Lysinibacillus sphaericus]MBG9477014.1 hypothetical protein [Lysinibacillus sphaericus]MBG9591096.1 hypothetical protein [Lysinibacillus sphaericus]
MILDSLYIFTPNDGQILKEYPFNKKGVNIILGEKKEANNETNGVGKSTMVDCLSFLLGKAIPNYYQNNGDLLEKNIYIALKVSLKDATHFLARSFNDPQNGFLLENSEMLSMNVSEWKKVNLTSYKNYVENLILTEKRENITFAGLREYIIRDEKTGFNDILLPNRNGLKQYILLNYLFTLPYQTESEIKKLRDIIEKMNNEIKIIESMSVNITDLKVREEEVISKIDELDKAIKQAKTVTHFQNSTENYTVVKKELNDIQNKIFEYEHIKNQYQKNIENLKEKVDEIKQLEDVEQFYNDLVGFFPNDVRENYKKVKEFYDFMVDSRGNYFNDKIITLDSKLKKFYREKEVLEKELEETSKIFKSEKYIEDISLVMDKKRNKEVELAEIRVRINDYNKKNEIVENINEIQHKVLRINSLQYDEFQSFNETKKKLQTLFNVLVDVTYKQHGFLDFEYDNRISYSKNSTTGRVKISCSIPDERSHGRLHMKINMFDLTWFLHRVLNNSDINFLIHDGSYSNPDPYVKGVLLKYLDNKLKENSIGQYFVTLNKTELLAVDLEFFENKGMVVAKLDRLNDDKNRLFGFRF